MRYLEVAVEKMKKVILRVLPESYDRRWYSSLAYARRLRGWGCGASGTADVCEGLSWRS